jgi:putative ABC transport system ATP-binding protein
MAAVLPLKLTNRRANAMLRLEGIGVVRRETDTTQRRILDDVHCYAHSAQITTIVGPSGGGKSSLIRLINRLDDPTSGTIRLDGTDISLLDPLELRGRVAMAQQKPFMFEGTVLDNLQRPFLYRKQTPPEADTPDLLHSLELTRIPVTLLKRDARTLSLGEQQRVALCRALLTKPVLLLLDEPTSALDRPTADHLATTFREICHRERLAIMLVTHDLRLAEQLSDYLYYLEEGRIREEGEPAELFSAPRSEELRRFLGKPEREGSH